jgi:hypothetical protein
VSRQELIETLKKEALVHYNENVDLIENDDGGPASCDDGGIEEWLFKQRPRYKGYIDFDPKSEYYSMDEYHLHNNITKYIEEELMQLLLYLGEEV